MNILNSLLENPELADKITVNIKASEIVLLANELAERRKPEPVILPPDEKYLTADQVSDMLGVTRVTLWNWDKKGILVPKKIGNKVRYTQSDIDAAFINRPR